MMLTCYIKNQFPFTNLAPTYILPRMIALQEKNMDLIHDYLSRGWSFRKLRDALVFVSPNGDTKETHQANGEIVYVENRDT